MEQQNLRRIAERTIETFREHISGNGIEPKDVEAYFERCATLYINYTMIDKIVTMTGLKPRILEQYPYWDTLVEQARDLTLFPQFLEMQKDENSPAYESWGGMIRDLSRLFGTYSDMDGNEQISQDIIDILLGTYLMDWGIYGADDEIDEHLALDIVEFDNEVETEKEWNFGLLNDITAMETYLGRGSGAYTVPFEKDDYRTMSALLNSCLADGKEADKVKLTDWLEQILNDLEGFEFTPLGINHAAAFYYAANEETEEEWYKQFKPVTNSIIEVPAYRNDERFREFIPPYHVESICSDIRIAVEQQFEKSPVPYVALGNLIHNSIKGENIPIKETELREYEDYKTFVLEILNLFGKGPFNETTVEKILSRLAVCMVRPYVENFKHDVAENLLWTRNVQAYSEWVRLEEKYCEGGEYSWLVFAQEKPFVRIAKLSKFFEGASIEEENNEVSKVSWKQNLYSMTNLVGSVLDTLNEMNDGFYPTDLYHHRDRKFTGYDQPNPKADMDTLPEDVYIVAPLRLVTEESMLVSVIRSLSTLYPMDLNFADEKYKKQYMQPMDAELRQLEGELARIEKFLKRRAKAEKSGDAVVDENDNLHLIQEIADITKHLEVMRWMKDLFDENPHEWAKAYLDALKERLAEVDADAYGKKEHRKWVLEQAIQSTKKAVEENFKTELYKDYKKAPKAKFYPDVIARKPFYPKILTWGD